MPFYKQTVENVLNTVSSSVEGLSSRDAANRLKKYGPNSIKIKGEPLWRKLIEPFANVFIGVLLVAVVISIVYEAYIDAAIVIAIIFASAIIYYIQRFSTERVLRSLQKHTKELVDVSRNGRAVRLDVSRLVPGDIIHLSEGDKVPADVRLFKANNLQVDESMLTGESEPIRKQTEALRTDKPLYEQSNMLFSGSFIVSGQAAGVVVLTGNNTEFGRIAALTGTADTSGNSPVQKKIDKLITMVVAIISAVAVVAFALAVLRGIEVGEALRFVIALSVSAIPEGLPIAISVILVLAMRRMATKKAFVKSMRAIESIGVVTTIATDKTGTLTENKLSVQEVWQPRWGSSKLVSDLQRSINQNASRKTHDPLDVALLNFARSQKASKPAGKLAAALPFDQSVAMSGNIWSRGGKYELFIKGAPERILKNSRLNDDQREEAAATLKSLTSQGYRVIAVASATLSQPIDKFSELSERAAFDFLGLVAVADTLRPVARKAIITAQNAGVKVRMITGDHFETAYHIGLKLGMVTSRSQVFDSRQMDTMSDKELKKVIQDTLVFSRVTPENKFRILQILRLKEVTAMTGDGVNDVPALANAHVGIAMGSGAQIAKDAGDIVLLNDNFASIVNAMREGRVVYSNVRRMLIYLLSTNMGEVVVSLVALIVGLPIPLQPVQILWTNLMTDTAMVIPLGLEPAEKDVMKQKPISPKAPIFTRYMVARIILVAATMGFLVLGFFIHYMNLYGVEYGRTIAFSSLIIIQWANAFNYRSTYESIFSRIRVWSGPFYIGLAIAVAVQYLAFFGPLQEALHIHPVEVSDIFITGAISFIVMIAVTELHKIYGRWAQKKQG